jgi:hypothetical protein
MSSILCAKLVIFAQAGQGDTARAKANDQGRPQLKIDGTDFCPCKNNGLSVA